MIATSIGAQPALQAFPVAKSASQSRFTGLFTASLKDADADAEKDTLPSPVPVAVPAPPQPNPIMPLLFLSGQGAPESVSEPRASASGPSDTTPLQNAAPMPAPINQPSTLSEPSTGSEPRATFSEPRATASGPAGTTPPPPTETFPAAAPETPSPKQTAVASEPRTLVPQLLKKTSREKLTPLVPQEPDSATESRETAPVVPTPPPINAISVKPTAPPRDLQTDAPTPDLRGIDQPDAEPTGTQATKEFAFAAKLVDGTTPQPEATQPAFNAPASAQPLIPQKAPEREPERHVSEEALSTQATTPLPIPDMQHDTTTVATQRTTETTAPAAVDQTPQPDEQPQSSSPLNEITLRVDGANQTAASIRLVSRNSELRVAVHTSDAHVADSLRANVEQLTTRLSNNGWGSEIWKPTAIANANGRGQPADGQMPQHNSHKQKQPDWIEEFYANNE